MKLYLLGTLLLSAVVADNAEFEAIEESKEIFLRGLRPDGSTSGSSAGSSTCGTDHSDVPTDDMWIRFNKILFPHDTPPEAEVGLPMMPEDYPICPSKCLWQGWIYVVVAMGGLLNSMYQLKQYRALRDLWDTLY